ncbi:polyadenylate-binding protein RBP45C-like [Argentina anserina]|uniref:polyadenylate-binding protein RBP45C-like n=1 Tax=Argentina anserina TaxID=57926 RepID=UPI0021763DE9|nr:polyadenylate-binding protein RBP45C-like [Potentilla anserina]
MMQQPSGGAVPQADQQAQQYQQQPPQQWMMMPPQQQQQQQAAQAAGWAQQQQQAAMQQQQPQQYAAAAGQGSDEIRSLWIGDLLQWMDETYILSCFGGTGEAVNAKVIRNKQSGLPEGYGFIEFRTRAAAEQVLQNYNGTVMPQTEQNFRLNWATLGAGERRQDDGPDYTIFVGDLAADVTDYTLQETFRAHYHSVKGAKVVTDRNTGRSKGYGFVRFGDETEQVRALNEMNGQFCSSRQMRIGLAATKKPIGGAQPFQKAAYPSTQGNPGEADPNNTTIFVGGLDPSVDDEMLRQAFGIFGELVHVKIPVGKRCGFVQFANRASAEQALSVMNGRLLGSQSVRLSWGRSPTSKQNQPEQTQWNGAGGAGFYQYPQGYDAYTYAPPAQDPNLYYGGYAGYGNYQQPGAAYQQPQQ